MFATKTFIEYKRTRNPSRSVDETTRVHLVKTLRLLQAELTERDKPTSEATILAIIYLSIVASCVGDAAAARHHAEGLSKIIDLIGGADKLGPLCIKAYRADIGASLACGSKPLLSMPGLTWERHLPEPVTLADDLGLKALLSYFDSKLVNAWADLRSVCSTANRLRAGDESTKYNLNVYHSIMLPIMYRLLRLQFMAGTPDEALRLALVVFTASVYLQFRGHLCRFDYMAESLQVALDQLPSRRGGQKSMQKLVLWMYYMSAIAYGLDKEKPQTLLACVKARTVDIEMASWGELRDTFKGLLWIDSIHDDVGKHVYEVVEKL
ncbi:hypothetical protein GQ53DRAFT_647811 [Thozetella sp. PMI_491]|nr:hypothetical protein GQ53DRAFT_647811 [Thozetella sp. PMI_491]